MRTALLTCALLVAACGGNDNRPAQDPSTTTSSTTLTNAPSSAAPDTASPRAWSSPASSDSSSNVAAPNAQTAVPAKPAPVDTAPAPAPAASDAVVANNPGAHDQTKNADDTKINDRDRHGALTPMAQGNSGDEIKITAAIRRAVMGDKSLSFTAKNVKIITVGSKVTLRGPVNSDQERAAIETRAKQTPGVSEVDNQIEVKK